MPGPLIHSLTLLKQVSLGLFGIVPGNYSGITHIAGNEYAIVNDKDDVDGFQILNLDMDSLDGSIRVATMREPDAMSIRRAQRASMNADCEGVAYCDVTNTVFVSREQDQRIVEYTLDGEPTGREMAVPQSMGIGAIRPNYGFEALSYNPVQQRFWTTTESTLPADGPSSTLQNKDVGNRLRMVSFDAQLQPVAQYAYEMERPISKGREGMFVHGVPAVLALDDGSLLVMEREAFIPGQKLGSLCNVKIYLATPTAKCRLDDNTSLQSLSSKRMMHKTLLAEFATHVRLGKFDFANYEGMCFGPTLADGRRTLLLISDSQGGAGNSLFHLKDYIKVLVID